MTYRKNITLQNERMFGIIELGVIVCQE